MVRVRVTVWEARLRTPVPKIAAFATARGAPDSALHTSIAGSGLESVSEVRFSGSGVRARIVGSSRNDRIDVAIDIAVDAAPGPRAVLLRAAGSDGPAVVVTDCLFHVVARSSHGGLVGIGGHLI
jgi:hypothetical protein